MPLVGQWNYATGSLETGAGTGGGSGGGSSGGTYSATPTQTSSEYANTPQQEKKTAVAASTSIPTGGITGQLTVGQYNALMNQASINATSSTISTGTSTDVIARNLNTLNPIGSTGTTSTSIKPATVDFDTLTMASSKQLDLYNYQVSLSSTATTATGASVPYTKQSK